LEINFDFNEKLFKKRKQNTEFLTSKLQCFKTRTGPAGRPGPGTGPGEGKNPLGNWPGETRSTRRVDPRPGPPGQTRVRPGQLTIARERRGGMA